MYPDGRYIYFHTGFAFWKLFGSKENKDLLISFLNALLQGREEVTDLSYVSMPEEQRLREEYECRRSVIDARCTNKQNEHFLVELQKADHVLCEERSVYYSAFAIRGQAPKARWDYDLKGIYIINIADFGYGKQNSSYYHEVKLVDTLTKEVFCDSLTFIYLEMSNFTKSEDELDTLFDKWLYAIRHMASLEERPQALQEDIFRRLFDVADMTRYSREEFYAYEASLKACRDWYSVLKTAAQKGRLRVRVSGI